MFEKVLNTSLENTYLIIVTYKFILSVFNLYKKVISKVIVVRNDITRKAEKKLLNVLCKVVGEF